MCFPLLTESVTAIRIFTDHILYRVNVEKVIIILLYYYIMHICLGLWKKENVYKINFTFFLFSGSVLCVMFIDCLVCVFAPHVLRDPVSVSQSLCHLIKVCLDPSPVILCLKAQSIQLVFVGSWMSSLPVFMFPGELKSRVCEVLVSSIRASLTLCENVQFNKMYRFIYFNIYMSFFTKNVFKPQISNTYPI